MRDRILEILKEAPKPLAVTEISDILGVPVPEVGVVMNELIKENALEFSKPQATLRFKAL